MEKFRLQVDSMPLKFIQLSILITLGLTFVIVSFIIGLSELMMISVSLVLLIILDYFTRKLSRGEVEYTISKEGIRLNWVKPFRFFKRENVFLKWHQIESYKYMTSGRVKVFRIKSKNGQHTDICFEDTPENFYDFYHNFEEKVKSLNADTRNNSVIERKKTFDDTWIGRELITIMGSAFLIMVILSLFLRPLNEQNWFLLIFIFILSLIMLGIRWFIYQVKRHNKMD